MLKKLENKILTDRAVLIWGCVLCIAALLLMEYSPWGSRALEQYNGGYGTFDMKSYNADTVYRILHGMMPEGFRIYELYFIMDFLFVIGYGIVQIRLLNFFYRDYRHNIAVRFAYWIPAARAVFDTAENSIILLLLISYPAELRGLVAVSSAATFLKLKAIILWSLFIAAGILVKITVRVKKQRVNES